MAEENRWLSRLFTANQYFGRFARDIGGVLLLALALILFVGLLGWTTGNMVSAWVKFVKNWFGWGSILVVITIGTLGIIVLRRSDEPLPWGRLITLEFAAFLTLGMLTVVDGRDLARAEVGNGGGRLGWGLERILTDLTNETASLFIFIVGWFLAVMSGFNLWVRLEKWLLRFGGDAEPEPIEEVLPAEEVVEEAPKETPRKRPRVDLPPEFRKALSARTDEDERPSKPRPRDERLPPLDLLLKDKRNRLDERTINQTAGLIEKTLNDFGIPAQVIGFRVGPAITQFAVQPGFIDKSTSEEDWRFRRSVCASKPLCRGALLLALKCQTQR